MIGRSIKKEFSKSKITNQYQVGFAIYDLNNKQTIFEKDADKYYTPASNTKLFTYFAGLKVAPDSIPSLRYIEQGDSLIFWGTGDPSFLHTELKGNNAYKFLKNTKKQLFYSPGRYTGDFYGVGWQWDDYNDYYQAEINELPLMDNMVLVMFKNQKLEIMPRSFASCFGVDSTNNAAQFSVTRDFLSNHFNYPKAQIPQNYSQQIPYKVSLAQTINLLSDTLHKTVQVIKKPFQQTAKTIYSSKSDRVFKQLLQPSDNFVAEQLLLTYADKLGIEMNTSKVIDTITKLYLKSLPDKPKWVDGSGLSRGNLFTPRTMVRLLELIYEEVNNQPKLFDILPAGGKSGTLRNAYPKTDNPFVFGKTGTLSNNHNQSGYLVTKKGKVLLFSYMNNNFVLPTTSVRNEMVRIITKIHDKF